MSRSIPSALPGAVVIGGYINGLGVARGLAARRIPVDLVVTRPYDIAQYSWAVRRAHTLLEFHSEPSNLVDLLVRRSDSWRGWALIPTNDLALATLAQNRDTLDRWYPPTVPPWEVTQRVLDNAATLRAAQQVGIDRPLTYGPATSLFLKSLPRQRVSFPILVKPAHSHLFRDAFGTKLFLANNHEELSAAVARVETAGLEALLVDFIPGGDRRCFVFATYVDAAGESVAGFTYRRTRQVPHRFGVASAAEPVDLPELHEPSIELLRRLEWRGIAAVEYKQDPRDGRYRLLEVNGRSCVSNAMTRRAGFDHPYCAWSEHAARQPLDVSPTGWQGIWLHLHADLLYRLLRPGSQATPWREFMASYGNRRIYAAWSPSDPRPFAVQWGRSLLQAARLPFDRRLRRRVRRQLQTYLSLS